MPTADQIRATPLFADLSRAAADAIAQVATDVRFDAGEMIMSEGEPADEFFVLVSGKVSVEIHAPGHGPMVIDTLAGGDVLGVSWLLPPYQVTFDAHAADDTVGLVVDAKALRERSESDPVLAAALFRSFAVVISQRLHSSRLRLVDLHGGHAR